MNDMSVAVNLAKTETKPLSFVTEFHEIRPVNLAYVERLRTKIREIGVKPYPLSVTPDGILFGGRHRYEAFKAEGIIECLMHIAMPISLDREAIELNRASEDALPMTFVDYAEMVWRRINDGVKQQALADELGWSREKIKNFAALNNVCPEAWQIVGTALQNSVPMAEGDDVPKVGTDVPFTENLLRNIIPLSAETQASAYTALEKLPDEIWEAARGEPQADEDATTVFLRSIIKRSADQQTDLVRKLARGKNTKGHAFTKKDFKEEAERYRAYNALHAAAFSALEERIQGERLEANKAEVAEELKQRAYIDEFIQKNEPGAKFQRLIQSYIDAYEEAMNIRVLIRDIRELTAVDIEDGSVDAVVTDPPYPKEYVGLFDDLGALAARVLKPGGSLLCLCGQSYLPQYIELLSRHLDYQWVIGVHMPGGQAVQLHQREVTAFWKPILWFTKGPRDGKWVSDFIRTDVNNNDKVHHKWGQSEQIMQGMIERVSLSGETILDPFLGGGTAGVVCRKMKRKFIGVEKDEAVAKAAQLRIGGDQ
jgi:site-specific DNA-methyltransferase (adenine-specific)